MGDSVAQLVKTHVAKPDNLNSVPRAHMVGEALLLQVVL